MAVYEPASSSSSLWEENMERSSLISRLALTIGKHTDRECEDIHDRKAERQGMQSEDEETRDWDPLGIKGSRDKIHESISDQRRALLHHHLLAVVIERRRRGGGEAEEAMV